MSPVHRPEWLTLAQAARRLGISQRDVQLWKQRGLVRLARDWRGRPLVHEDDVWLMYFSIRRKVAPLSR